MGARSGRATLAEVAETAGVSAAAVSMVMNGRAGLPAGNGRGCGTTYRWFGTFAPSRVAPWPSCFVTDSPVPEDSP